MQNCKFCTVQGTHTAVGYIGQPTVHCSLRVCSYRVRWSAILSPLCLGSERWTVLPTEVEVPHIWTLDMDLLDFSRFLFALDLPETGAATHTSARTMASYVFIHYLLDHVHLTLPKQHLVSLLHGYEHAFQCISPACRHTHICTYHGVVQLLKGFQLLKGVVQLHMHSSHSFFPQDAHAYRANLNILSCTTFMPGGHASCNAFCCLSMMARFSQYTMRSRKGMAWSGPAVQMVDR